MALQTFIGEYRTTGESQPGVNASSSLTPNAYNQIITDASSMTLTLDAGTRCAIQWIAAKDRIIIGTSSNEWSLSGHGVNKSITPTSYSLKKHKTKGSKDMQPLVVNSSVMFVNYVGKKLFEMLWEGVDETYSENDLLLLAEHITYDTEIVTMAYQKNPDSIIWATLDDGTLISCTYDREQEVVAWARHPMSTGGESTAGVPAIPPAPIRDEAYVIANNTDVVWFDPDWNVLSYEDLADPGGSSNICGRVISTSEGICIAGYSTAAASGPCTTRWDTDLTHDENFFVPDAGYSYQQYMGAGHLSENEDYWFTRSEDPDGIYKFDMSDGSQIWFLSTTSSSHIFDLYSNDSFIVGPLAGSRYSKYDKDANLLDTYYAFMGGMTSGIVYDEENDRVYGCGAALHLPNYYQVKARNWDGTNYDLFSWDNDNSDQGTGILKIGDYIYVTAQGRNQAGVGGAWASVYKLDEELNLVASYDPGRGSYGLFLDHDDNIVVVAGDHDGGDSGAGLWVLDTDLNYISNHTYNTNPSGVGGLSGTKIPYLDDGTPAIPPASVTGLGANSVCTIPGDEEDEVWISVGRVIDGALVRYIERMKPRNWGTDQEDCFFVDSGLTYDSTATDTFTGLDHLEGETVAILGDGAVLPSEVVSGGSITTDESVSVCHIGLPYTYKLKPMRIDQNFGAGTSKGSIKKITEAIISFDETLNARYSDGTTSRGIDFRTTEEYTTPPDLYTGDKKVVSDGGFSVEDPFQIKGSDPLPCTVRAIIPRTEITGR